MNRIGGWKKTMVVVVATVGLGACGGSGGNAADLDDDEQQLVDVLAANMETEGEINAQEAQCWATGVVTRVGVERLDELGISVESGAAFTTLASVGATQAEADEITDALFDCVDPTEDLEAALAQQVDAATASCVMDKLDETTVKSLVSAQLYGGEPSDEAQAKVLGVISECASG